MKKYIVCAYHKVIGSCLVKPFDNKKQALVFISENKLVDKMFDDSKNWIYKVVGVNFYE